MSTYAYLRVSRDTQENEKFKYEILKYANSHNLGNVQFFEEVAYSKKDWKTRVLGDLINTVAKKGDVILVPELSRISRSIPQIYDICQTCQSKGITLYFLKQNLTIGKENDITTKIMLNTLSLCAEIEISYIQERTKEALRARKEQGVKLGRPKGIVGHSKLDKFGEEIWSLRKNGASLTFIGKKYGATPITVSTWLKKHSDPIADQG